MKSIQTLSQARATGLANLSVVAILRCLVGKQGTSTYTLQRHLASWTNSRQSSRGQWCVSYLGSLPIRSHDIPWSTVFSSYPILGNKGNCLWCRVSRRSTKIFGFFPILPMQWYFKPIVMCNLHDDTNILHDVVNSLHNNFLEANRQFLRL